MGGRGAFLRIKGSGMIDISIASYRDPQLVPTVRSAFDNAKDPKGLRFNVVSQAENDEHPDLSFIPEEQLNYQKFHWKESKGVCWARHKASQDLRRRYFLQIDSHSRFRKNWDEIIVNAYEKSFDHYGSIVFSCHPDGYTVLENGEDEKELSYSIPKVLAQWDEKEKMIGPTFGTASSNPFGDEIYYLAAGSLFCYSDYLRMIPYDPLLYFAGEEASLALRLHTRGIRIINTPVKFMWHEYKSSWKEGEKKRQLHWDDDPDWAEINRASYERLSLILSGDMSFGIYGIGSEELYNDWIDKTGIDLRSKKDAIASWGK
jgi:hypothetical protein